MQFLLPKDLILFSLSQAKATVLPVPVLITAGVAVPERYAENWAPALAKANFSSNSSRAVKLSPVVFYHKNLRNGCRDVYNSIRNLVNGFHASYMFGEHVDFVETGMLSHTSEWVRALLNGLMRSYLQHQFVALITYRRE